MVETDYFLFDLDGNFVDFVRSGTCSHEGLPDSFEGSYRVMKKDLEVLLTRNNLKAEDITSAVFGLAGVDTPSQKAKLQEVIERLGFKKFEVVNDSFLGIKPVTKVGVCSINGTGTSTGGIDLDGKCLQVGGIGYYTGDEAGGRWLAKRAIRQAFDSMYRFGKPTILTDFVMEKLGIDDKEYFAEAITYNLKNVNLHELTLKVFDGANAGDEVCLDLLREMADNLNEMKSKLFLLASNAKKPVRICVNKKVFLMGSDYAKMDCVIRNNRYISRCHAKIYYETGCYFIEDVGSMNGTYINGVKLAEGIKYKLETGDLINLADCKFEVDIKN